MVLTAAEERQAEQWTVEQESLDRGDLMERAGRGVADEVKVLVGAERKRVFVFAGRGGNGGDALVVARLLSVETNCELNVYLINNEGNLNAECELNRDRLRAECPDVAFTEVVGQFSMPVIGEGDIVIDGLFGSGLSRPLSGGHAMLVKLLNKSGATIVAIDVPSGLMAEDNSQNYKANIVQATLTLSIGALKPCFLMSDNQKVLGRWKVVDIGLQLPDELRDNLSYRTTEAEDAKRLRRERNCFGNKGTFGHGLLIAGQFGMAGAAILSARAALRSGLGKLTVHTPRCNNNILQIAVPEAVLHHDEENYAFGTAVRLDGFSALALGPGLGTKKDTAQAMIRNVSGAVIPVVIDADGLNILADHLGWLRQLPPRTVLTPHPREFQRLFGESLSGFEMLKKARDAAQDYGIFIVLKGHYTAIYTPEGKTFINMTGNSGMATAGTGDVLTGVLLGLLAQGYREEDALRLGVYLHGRAGDIAAEALSEEGMTAGDVVECLPKAFKELVSEERGVRREELRLLRSLVPST